MTAGRGGRGALLALAGLLAAGLLGAALWLLARGEGGPSEGARGRRGWRGEAAARETRGGLGVAARRVDAAGAPEVFGRVEDVDGLAVDDGRLILHCLGEAGAGLAVELGPEGEFRGPGCVGVACAELVHSGLVPREPWVLAAGEAATLVARPLGRREGVVVDPEGRPVAGARLMARAAPGEEAGALPPFTSRSAVSDAEGRFAFFRVERPPCDPCGEVSGRCSEGEAQEVRGAGTIAVTARARGFRETVRTLVIEEGEETWEIRLEAPEAPVRGRLVDPEGAAYPRARILARSSERSAEIHHAAVGEDGSFELAELGEGSYEVRAIQDGVELAREGGVRAGAALALRGEARAAGVAVTIAVTTSDGRAVVGASVEGGPFAGALTDEDGRVAAEQVLPGEYALFIRPPGLRPQRHAVVIGGEGGAVRIALAAGGR